MIVSDSFVRSQKARDSDFTTNSGNSLFTIICSSFIAAVFALHLCYILCLMSLAENTGNML